MNKQSLARTLIVGAGLGILLPALVLAAFLFTDRQEREINLRVRVPLSQYADVLARGMAVAIWNLDKEVAGQLVEAVMRNPDVAEVTVLDEYKERFAHGESSLRAMGDHLREQREVVYNRRVIGHVIIDMSTRRVQLGLLADLSELGLALLIAVLLVVLLDLGDAGVRLVGEQPAPGGSHGRSRRSTVGLGRACAVAARHAGADAGRARCRRVAGAEV